MYFTIHSGSYAPAEQDLPSLATIFSQTLKQLARSRKLSINKLMEELSIAVLVAVAFPWMLLVLTVA